MQCPCLRVLATAVLSAITLSAQYPGTYPPGRYPGGYPSGGGIPFPRRSKQPKTPASKQQQPQTQKIRGRLEKIDSGSLTIKAEDTRTVTAKLSDKTAFYSKAGDRAKADQFHPGDEVRIEATQDDQGYYTASAVYLEREATPAERAEAVATAAPKPEAEQEPPAHSVQQLPPLARTREDVEEDRSGPPRIKRGKPDAKPAGKVSPADPPPERSPVQTTAAVKPPGWRTVPSTDTHEQAEDARLEKAREAVGSYTHSLPDYICQEQIARFVSTSKPIDWRPQDIVSTALVFESGREQYRDITVNGKPVKQKMEELSGSWSTGEFGTMTADLFSPATAAEFQMVRHTSIAGRDAMVYKFEVDQEHSHWHIQAPGQSMVPAYKGSVWIDDKTFQVLRVEMQATKMPKAFPLDTVESAVDYEYTRIGDGTFLVPVHAETLACVRGTSNCSRNVIDFRNYHKFSGASKITF